VRVRVPVMCVRGYRGDVWEWHVSVIDDDIVPAFPRRPFRWHFI